MSWYQRQKQNNNKTVSLSGPVHAYKQDASQRKKYDRLKAMKRYHKFFGKVRFGILLCLWIKLFWRQGKANW